ncbi:hypothetical protein GUJ93_ZPchr0010g9485 [Zizania palustris]|uniref:Uncharacterized protein n=1 Tax=Zizania palustris TaxID=103762 RepID=A0A8J5WDT0_ZIZPA|nr:hypothetical protein GUJ93_ZPchr0010g9485 [Zizania palustris]
MSMSKLKFFVAAILVILLLFDDASSGQAGATDISDEVTSKVTERYSRTLKTRRHGARRVLTDLLDYDYGGANARHEPRKKPGNGH